MAGIGNAFKDEITRLSKKVVKEQLAPLQSTTSSHRRLIAALKRQVATLERQVAGLTRSAGRQKAVPELASGVTRTRFQARGLRSLRIRLGLSAEELGRLIEVSAQSVYNWEAEKSTPRQAQIESLARLRAIGKREAQARLRSLASKG